MLSSVLGPQSLEPVHIFAVQYVMSFAQGDVSLQT